MILKGDLENSGDRGSLVKEDIAKKYISYFNSILHHNNGYFCLVSGRVKCTFDDNPLSVSDVRNIESSGGHYQYLPHRLLPVGEIYEVRI